MGNINSNLEMQPVIKTEQILSARKIVNQIYIAENIQEYSNQSLFCRFW